MQQRAGSNCEWGAGTWCVQCLLSAHLDESGSLLCLVDELAKAFANRLETFSI